MVIKELAGEELTRAWNLGNGFHAHWKDAVPFMEQPSAEARKAGMSIKRTSPSRVSAAPSQSVFSPEANKVSLALA